MRGKLWLDSYVVAITTSLEYLKWLVLSYANHVQRSSDVHADGKVVCPLWTTDRAFGLEAIP